MILIHANALNKENLKIKAEILLFINIKININKM